MAGLLDRIFKGLSNNAGAIADSSVKIALDNVHDALDAVRTVLLREQSVHIHVESMQLEVNSDYKYIILTGVGQTVKLTESKLLYGLDFYVINKSSSPANLVTPTEAITLPAESVTHFLYSDSGVIILN